MRKEQNTSAAVMARRDAPPDSADFFPTPPWATRALCERLSADHPLERQVAYDPAVGLGHMAVPLSEFFAAVHASDLYDYGLGMPRIDFTTEDARYPADWIVTNPPFVCLAAFGLRALERARVGVALLVRTAALEGAARFSSLYAARPPTLVLQFSERVAMVRGRYNPAASTATAYCWLVWDLTRAPGTTSLEWIPPGSRARHERATDASIGWWSEP
jgi:hypothetical protein